MKGPHEENELVGGRYAIQSYVGEGGMQYVYRAKDLVLNRDIALKTPKNNTAQKRFFRSATVAAQVNHPNVAKTLDYLEDKGIPYLAEELIHGEDLDKAFLKKTKYLDPYLAARVFHYLAKGLAASHHAGVVHRDLKPTNVMVTGGFQVDAIKITDFGIAKMAGAEIEEAVDGGDSTITTSQTAVGALPYMAPEAIDAPKTVSYPADVWSIGAMMYELLTGEKPFGSGLRAVSKIVAAVPPSFPSFVTENKQLKPLANDVMELILLCLQKDPCQRPVADDIVEHCGRLFYPIVKRQLGDVDTIKHNAWGFIDVDGTDVFFNVGSVYGEKVEVGDKVMLSQFPGNGAWRAHPVVKIYD